MRLIFLAHPYCGTPRTNRHADVSGGTPCDRQAVGSQRSFLTHQQWQVGVANILWRETMKLHPRRVLHRVSVVAATITTAFLASPAAAGNAILNMVLVLDGMRPDSITPDETPHLWRLRQEGVNFLNGHSVFPTVTRANATAIATGTYPDRNGIFGNTLYVRQVDPNHAFGNDDHQNLLRTRRRHRRRDDTRPEPGGDFG